MTAIVHTVWGTPAPPVCTTRWDQAAWDRFADRHRPAGYTGDRFDTEAWAAYREGVRKATAAKERHYWYQGILAANGPEAAAAWLRANEEANP